MRTWFLLLLAACTDPKVADADGDGYPASEDCNDANAAVHPGATEVCDVADIDEDCNGAADGADPGVTGLIGVFRDSDGDGWGDATEIPACEASTGYTAVSGDCDDADPLVSPDGEEVCDDADVDEDCDGLVDDADDSVDVETMVAYWMDADGDGAGAAGETSAFCDPPDGWSEEATDCDDADEAVHPGADERCNGVDDDCDSAVDEDAIDAQTWGFDDDGDGYGDPSLVVIDCEQPGGYVADTTDCDDVSAGRHPGADEYCNGDDDNCDGTIDEDAAVDVVTWYGDDDGDGFGEDADSSVDCDAPTGYVALAGDCDDRDAAVSPDAAEICDAGDVDEDCDGAADDADTGVAGRSAFYADTDGDGYGDPAASTAACDAPAGTVADDNDCDDTNTFVNPAGAEICDPAGADEDCDGLVDDADPSVDTATHTTWYVDADDDGFGTSAGTLAACDLPSGYSATATDCDDTSSARNPGAIEVCDTAQTDEDCDGYSDDGDTSVTGETTWFVDVDGDGYGDDGGTLAQCELPAGYAAVAGDCDDATVVVNPGAAEDCSSTLDENCDGVGLCEVGPDEADRHLYGVTDEFAGMGVAAGDLDADGVDELVVSGYGDSSNAGAIWVFEGGGTGDVSTASAVATWVGTGYDYSRGREMAVLGDVDGDGTAELAISSHGDSTSASGAGAVYLVSGLGSGSLSSDSYATLLGVNANDAVGDVAALGDVDGDGLADLAVGHNRTYGGGHGYVLSGIAAGVQSLSTATADLTDADAMQAMAYAVSGPGDLDGDGLDDLVVTDHSMVDYADCAVLIFYGPIVGSLDPTSADAGRSAGTSGPLLGSRLGPRGGDVDGDGHPDILVNTPSYSAADDGAWLIPGPASGTGTIDADAVRIRNVATATGQYYGDYALANDGDFDGDGFADVAIGDHTDETGGYYGGVIDVYFGPLSGSVDPDDADATIVGNTMDAIGYSMVFAGPQSGTADELLIGAPFDTEWGVRTGTALLYSMGSF